MADTRTSDELIDKVAAHLGRLEPGEALGAIESDTIDNCIDTVLEEIADIVPISDRDEIPLRYFETISRLVAVHAASLFNNAELDLKSIEAHESRLRYLADRAPSYERHYGLDY